MSANTYLQVTELDFNDIRTNLKSYLSTQTEFRDYNFEGSAMAVLLDVLAYNTHYNSYYTNMLANEMFLDTAQQRDSVVSRAKELGYVPVSAIGATANVNITFTGLDAEVTQLSIPKNSKFSSTVDDITYTYVTPEAYTVVVNNGAFSKDIEIKEGEPLTHTYLVDSSDSQRFIIPNKNVDTSSIVVHIQESATDTTTTEFTRASNIKEVFSSSPIYFLEEASAEKYELIFAKGSLGKPVKNGNIIIVDYIVCSGDATNGADTFSIDTLNVGQTYTTATLTVNDSARGGRPQEDIASIKYNAPKNYQTQNRAVIDSDYQRILLNENADLQSVVAFGGEKATPPVYGKVYIAVKPYGEQFATNSRKLQIRESISDRTPLGIDPVLIDPDYTYIIPYVTTYYDKTSNLASTAQIEQEVRDRISLFSETNLERFENRLRYSRFVRDLDDAANGNILNNDATLRLQKRLVPNTNVAEKVELRFNNPIRPSTVTSTQFTYDNFLAYLEDDGLGGIDIYRFNDSKQKVSIVAGAGTIDYVTGDIIIENYNPSAYADIQVSITVTPDRLDIIPVREQILIMSPSDAVIDVIGEYT